jgi:hypothetical protein
VERSSDAAEASVHTDAAPVATASDRRSGGECCGRAT